MKALLVVVGMCVSGSAMADALPPRESCPSGKVWVDSHSGGGCQLVAPKNCAAGWTGAIGGTCIVDEPWDDKCRDGYTAKDVTLCIQEFDDRGNGRVYYDPPRVGRAVVGIMGEGTKCEGDRRKTEAAKVCLSGDAKPIAYVSAKWEVDGPRVAGSTSSPDGLTPKKSSCAGAEPSGLTVALLMLAYFSRRMPWQVARKMSPSRAR